MAAHDDIISIELTREEAAMLYTASFYLTNSTMPETYDQGPTAAQTAQMKLAEALEEDVPEAALQDVQRALTSAQERAAQRNAQLGADRSQRGM
jgi:hypothetical protein